MTYPYQKNERVLVEGFKFGRVYQDTPSESDTVPVILDRAKASVINIKRRDVKPMSAEDEARLNIELNSPTIFELGTVEIPEGLMALMFGPRVGPGTPHTTEFTGGGSIKDGNMNEWQVSDHSKRGPIKDGVEEKFLYKEGDRVKLKYNKNTGTVARDQTDPQKTVLIHWDKAKPFDKSTDEKGGRELWEYPRNLTVLHAPRATDPANPDQELIDQLEALRLPIKARIERDQAILSKLTAAKKILKKG